MTALLGVLDVCTSENWGRSNTAFGLELGLIQAHTQPHGTKATAAGRVEAGPYVFGAQEAKARS